MELPGVLMNTAISALFCGRPAERLADAGVSDLTDGRFADHRRSLSREFHSAAMQT
jgi:hypothetical protein